MMLIKEAKHFYPRCRDRLYVDADVIRKHVPARVASGAAGRETLGLVLLT
jgi:hypothetical protein